MTAPFTISIAPRRADPRCMFCGGTGTLRLPTNEVYDLAVECDCARPVDHELEAHRCAEWDQVLP